MRKWVLSGILASEETYLSHLEALLLVRLGPGAVHTLGLQFSLLLLSTVSLGSTSRGLQGAGGRRCLAHL